MLVDEVICLTNRKILAEQFKSGTISFEKYSKEIFKYFTIEEHTEYELRCKEYLLRFCQKNSFRKSFLEYCELVLNKFQF